MLGVRAHRQEKEEGGARRLWSQAALQSILSSLSTSARGSLRSGSTPLPVTHCFNSCRHMFSQPACTPSQQLPAQCLKNYQHMGWGLTQTSINTWLPEGMPGATPWVPLFSNCCIDGQLVGLQKPHSCAQTAHTHTPSCSPLRLLLSLLQLLRTTAQGFKLMGWDIPAVVQRWTKGRCCGPSGCTATITLFAVAVAAAGYCAAAIAIAASNC